MLKVNPNENKQLYILDLKTYDLYCCFARPHISPLWNERISSSFISRSILHFIRENMVSLGQFSREHFERGWSSWYQLLTLPPWEQIFLSKDVASLRTMLKFAIRLGRGRQMMSLQHYWEKFYASPYLDHDFSMI